MGSLGISTAALAVAGNSPTSITEQWNGTNWTEVGDLNNGRPSPGASTNAPYTSAVVFGGGSYEANTELWNGTAWTETTNLNTGVAEAGGTRGGS